MKRTEKQNKRFWFLVNALGIDEETRKILVRQYTKDRTEHSSEMTQQEMEGLLQDLDAQYKALLRQRRQLESEKNKKRRKIFELFWKLGWFEAGITNREKNKRVNAWLSTRAGIKKDINELSLEELNKVIRQLNIIKRNYDREELRKKGIEIGRSGRIMQTRGDMVIVEGFPRPIILN